MNLSKLKENLSSLLDFADPPTPDTGWSKSDTFHHAHATNNASTELQTAFFLFALVLRHQPKLIVEIGSHRGLSGAWMITAMETYGGGSFIGYDVEDYKRYWSMVAEKTQTEFRHKAIWDDAQRPMEVDLLFHDSDHSEASTRREIDLIKPMIRPGGLLVMHDTSLCECGKVARQWQYNEGGWQFIDLKNARGLTIVQKRWATELTPQGEYKI